MDLQSSNLCSESTIDRATANVTKYYESKDHIIQVSIVLHLYLFLYKFEVVKSENWGKESSYSGPSLPFQSNFQQTPPTHKFFMH